MDLHYLEFEISEDAAGHGTFDAMAAAAPSALPALQQEVARVLAWAHGEFGEPGPLDEGHAWDCELQGVQEVATTLQVSYQAGAQRLALVPGATGAPRVTLSLTLSGRPEFCAALRENFGLA